VRSGIIFCFAGPSGSGKTTLADLFINSRKGQVSKVVTVTTRTPRLGEKHGLDYFFWTEDQFFQAVSVGLFFEHENVHGSNYGTLRSSLEEFVSSGKDAVIILDVNGAMTLKESFLKDSVTVFLTARSENELKNRIAERKSSPEEIERRLLAVSTELKAFSDNPTKFDYLIINDNIDQAYTSLRNITLHEYAKRGQPLNFEIL